MLEDFHTNEQHDNFLSSSTADNSTQSRQFRLLQLQAISKSFPVFFSVLWKSVGSFLEKGIDLFGIKFRVFSHCPLSFFQKAFRISFFLLQVLNGTGLAEQLDTKQLSTVMESYLISAKSTNTGHPPRSHK